MSMPCLTNEDWHDSWIWFFDLAIKVPLIQTIFLFFNPVIPDQKSRTIFEYVTSFVLMYLSCICCETFCDVSRFPHPVCNVHSLGRRQRLWQLAVRGSASIDLVPEGVWIGALSLDTSWYQRTIWAKPDQIIRAKCILLLMSVVRVVALGVIRKVCILEHDGAGLPEMVKPLQFRSR